MPFTYEELLEIQQADAEIEACYKRPYTAQTAAYQKAYREKNKAKIAACKAIWYQNNKEHVRAKHKNDYKRRRNAKTTFNTGPQPAPTDSSNSNSSLHTLLQS